MRVKYTALAAAVPLFLSVATATAAPPRERVSESTYFYNPASGRPVTGSWPPGCYASNPNPCAGLQLDDGYGSVYYFSTDDDGRTFHIHWPGKCWDLLNGGLGNGTPITLNNCSASATQRWELWVGEDIFGSNTFFKKAALLNVGSGRCLDAANPDFPTPPKIGARLQIWDCIKTIHYSNKVNQYWGVDVRPWQEWGTPP